MTNMYNNVNISAYKDIPLSYHDLSDDSISEDSDTQDNQSIVSISLACISPNKVDKNSSELKIEKSKDYYFDKENEDYKNFLGLCQDL